MLGTASVAIAGVLAYFSPYYVLDNLKRAIANRNPDALAQEIDFPSLRMSIKENIHALAVAKLTADLSAPQAQTAATVAKIVDPLVERLVTPEGLGDVMQDKVQGAKIDLDDLDRKLAAAQVRMGYESFDRFVVHIVDKVDRDRVVSFVLQRYGLTWKLSGIDISQV